MVKIKRRRDGLVEIGPFYPPGKGDYTVKTRKRQTEDQADRDPDAFCWGGLAIWFPKLRRKRSQIHRFWLVVSQRQRAPQDGASWIGMELYVARWEEVLLDLLPHPLFRRHQQTRRAIGSPHYFWGVEYEEKE